MQAGQAEFNLWQKKTDAWELSSDLHMPEGQHACAPQDGNKLNFYKIEDPQLWFKLSLLQKVFTNAFSPYLRPHLVFVRREGFLLH